MGIYLSIVVALGALASLGALAYFLTRRQAAGAGAPSPVRVSPGEKAPAPRAAKPANGASARPASSAPAAPAAPSVLRPASVRPPSAPPAPQGSGREASDSEHDSSGPNPLILVNAVGRTDPGLKRKHNEDSYLVLEPAQLFAVADGMGRHAAGEVASRLATETLSSVFDEGSFGEVSGGEDLSKEGRRLKWAILRANEVVFRKSQEVEQYHGMGTTMVALHFSRDKRRAAVVHAGDSRCYRLRAGVLTQLTTDHTLGAAGILGGNAAMLSKAVGIEENLDPDVLAEQPLPEDVYLLCSDGLSRMATHDQILESLISGRDLERTSNALIDMANQAGGRDNVTVILIRVERAALDGERPGVPSP